MPSITSAPGLPGCQLLAQYQPDRIKIDHELIRNIHRDGPRQSIVQAIIKCCTSLEIAVSAVGVERAEEWMWLESAGISQFQGNLFAGARLGPARRCLAGEEMIHREISLLFFHLFPRAL